MKNICQKCNKEIEGSAFLSLNDDGKLCLDCAFKEGEELKFPVFAFYGSLEERIAYFLLQCEYYNQDIDLEIKSFDEESVRKIKDELIDLDSINALIELFEKLKTEEGDNKPYLAAYNQIIRELKERLEKFQNLIIKSNGIYSPQRYLEAVTGNCYILSNEIPVLTEIENFLRIGDFDTHNYSLKETAKALQKGKPIVLVDCTDIDENSKMIPEYRWFCVPDNFIEKTE